MEDKRTVRLDGVECRHHAIINTGYYGYPKHIIVFVNNSTGDSYIWITDIAGVDFEEGETYDITAQLDRKDKRLRHVKQVAIRTDCEQQPDARDVLLGKATYDKKLCYTLDFKLKTLYNTKRKEKRYERNLERH